MTDEQLCDILVRFDSELTGIPFGKNKPECDTLLDNFQITDEMCKCCMMEWLKSCVEE
jgi:hypothetical protein